MGTIIKKGSLRCLLLAVLVWWLSALILCVLAAAVLRAHDAGSEVFGYVSSALSFVCAFLAGAIGLRGRGGVGAAMLCACGLCLMLLSVGAAAGRRAPDPSGVLSVLSFSLTGFLAGALLTGRKVETKQSQYKAKKKQQKNR